MYEQESSEIARFFVIMMIIIVIIKNVICFFLWRKEWIMFIKTASNGSLGSRNDEERSEMRYVMRIAGPRESSKFWTHIALLGNAQEHAYLSVPKPHSTTRYSLNDSASCVGLWRCKASGKRSTLRVSAPFTGLAPLKYNQFVIVTWHRPSGCHSEANATKDLVDALTCVP